jgi:hypothetical protein
MSRPATAIARALARTAGVKDPAPRWKVNRPNFDNQLATLALADRHSGIWIESPRGDWRDPSLETVLKRTVT